MPCSCRDVGGAEAIVEVIQSNFYTYLENIFKNEIIVRIVISLIIVIIGIIILAMIKGLFRRIETARVTEKATLENMYKLISTSVTIVLIFLIIYVLTRQAIIVIFILGVILIILASSWEVIANIAAYYAILSARLIAKGDYIILPNGIEGRVREITPLFTHIDGETRVYAVPNLLLLKQGRIGVKDPIKLEIIVRVWGIDDPDKIEGIIDLVRNKVATAGRDIMAIPEAARASIDEISVDSVSFRVELYAPGPKPNKIKLGRLLQEISVALRETGYSYTLTIEEKRLER